MTTSNDTKNGKITIHIFIDVHIDIKQEQQVSLKYVLQKLLHSFFVLKQRILNGSTDPQITGSRFMLLLVSPMF